MRTQSSGNATTRVAGSAGRQMILWASEARCRDVDPELFFPVGESISGRWQVERARSVCAGCSVQQACLDFALRIDASHGVWGGASSSERRRLVRARRTDGRPVRQEGRVTGDGA